MEGSAFIPELVSRNASEIDNIITWVWRFFTQKALIIWHCQKKRNLAPNRNTFVYIVTCVWMFDRFFVMNACFNTALPHCLFIEYEFQVCVCVSANDIKLVQALGNITISLAMKPLIMLNMKRIFIHCFHGSEAKFLMLYCTSCKMNGVIMLDGDDFYTYYSMNCTCCKMLPCWIIDNIRMVFIPPFERRQDLKRIRWPLPKMFLKSCFSWKMYCWIF